MKLRGVGASSGEVVAPVVILREGGREPLQDPVAALLQTGHELQALAEKSEGPLSEILEAQAMLATDPELIERVRALTSERGAPEAVSAALAPYKAALGSAESAYQRERVRDIEELERRALGALAGRGGALRQPSAPGVLAGRALSPADTSRVPNGDLLGIVSGEGGTLSHAAIISRALGIPAVLDLGEQIDLLEPGQWVLVDGGAGTVEVLERAPADARITARSVDARGDSRRGRTSDGTPIHLLANIGSIQDAEDAARLGAEGCGLLRTEFVVTDRREAPGVDEQVEIYDRLLAPLQGSVNVRAIDAGADKPLPFVDHGSEPNPALGRRGVRLLLAHPDLLADQGRALCRCRHADRIRLMLPMVTRARELDDVKALLTPVFSDEGRQLPIGAMIEVPAAAMAIAEIASACDFVSVGTNDLFQYLFAADRSQALGDALLEPIPAAVWQLLARVFEHAASAGVHAGVCGELAADPHAGGVLWALGASSLSVSPPLLPKLKDALEARSAAEWRELATRAVTS